MKNYSSEAERDLRQIRDMMERSSRFISLSGMSGVMAGIYAILASMVVHFWLGYPYIYNREYIRIESSLSLWSLAMLTILAAIATGILLTIRKARKKGLKVWDDTTIRLLINLFIPLAAGGLTCLALWYHQLFFLVAPATLVFYGLALINASAYTFTSIRYLGISEIIIGVIGLFIPGTGLLLWTIGFGVFHIIYGIWMQTKME